MFVLIVGMGLACSIWVVGVVGAMLAAQCDAQLPRSLPGGETKGSVAMNCADREGTKPNLSTSRRALAVSGKNEPPTWLDLLRRLFDRFKSRSIASTRPAPPTEGRLRSRPSGGGRYRTDASHRV